MVETPSLGLLRPAVLLLAYFVNMGNTVKVQRTPNNQYTITIPKTLAEMFDISQGTVLEFKVNEKGQIILRKK